VIPGALVAALAAASAFVASAAAFAALRRGFEQYQRHYLAPSLLALREMFLFLTPRQMLQLNVAALVLATLAGLALGGPLCAAGAAAAGFFAPALAVRAFRRRRTHRFEAQLADALQQMATALRAGLTVQQAIDQVGRESTPPLRQEFALLMREAKLGVPLDAALNAMAERVRSEELALVAISTGIARQLGGNMAEMFEGIAATIRERFRLEGKIAALTSQGRLQGIVVAALPPAMGLFLDLWRPDLIEPMFESGYGYALLGVIALLQTAGFLAIRRIVAIEV
jgi:tight adherence protein B